jgi:hypothetical protein
VLTLLERLLVAIATNRWWAAKSLPVWVEPLGEPGRRQGDDAGEGAQTSTPTSSSVEGSIPSGSHTVHCSGRAVKPRLAAAGCDGQTGRRGVRGAALHTGDAASGGGR